MDFLKNLFAGIKASPAMSTPPGQKKPPILDDQLAAFQEWFLAQKKPALALRPAPDQEIRADGCRFGGPAWIADGEVWPVDKNNVPLELLAQIDFSQCATLPDFPERGLLQFFVRREDLFGANFNDPIHGDQVVHFRQDNSGGGLQPPPPLEQVDDVLFSAYSPFENMSARSTGLMLELVPVSDQMPANISEANTRIDALYAKYEVDRLYDIIDEVEGGNSVGEHIGGYPRYVQGDIRDFPGYADFDTCLLNLGWAGTFMWGDAGECVFLIRSEDLKQGDFSRIAYSWDCS